MPPARSLRVRDARTDHDDHLSGPDLLASAAVNERADLIVTGDVYTVDAARSWAKAVAIRGDRIIAVGSEADVRERVGAAEVLSGASWPEDPWK